MRRLTKNFGADARLRTLLLSLFNFGLLVVDRERSSGGGGGGLTCCPRYAHTHTRTHTHTHTHNRPHTHLHMHAHRRAHNPPTRTHVNSDTHITLPPHTRVCQRASYTPTRLYSCWYGWTDDQPSWCACVLYIQSRCLPVFVRVDMCA
eukprot:GHVU01011779.1.p1 GENE.GHVU01011779.1~~GHVU01011779.1.p1  ORF type:complete len:148 (+),score=6.24 GHVU01011779.1:1110-1553(+)